MSNKTNLWVSILCIIGLALMLPFAVNVFIMVAVMGEKGLFLNAAILAWFTLYGMWKSAEWMLDHMDIDIDTKYFKYHLEPKKVNRRK